MKNSGAIILPIFFNVVPSDVRYTVKGVYAEALQKLIGRAEKTTSDPQTREKKPRHTLETIQNWKAALSSVADLSGFVHRGEQDDEGELLENVVERVLKTVPKTLLDVAKYPTGLDIKSKDFKTTVFSQESELVETKVIGIVGIGGVGKTTLAKTFFNSQRSSFKKSSFISDVREAAARMSLNSLQSKLIEDLQYRDITVDRHNGIELFRRHLQLCYSHVDDNSQLCHALIVLDDIDDISQLDAFLPLKDILSPGSLILVTSRDKSVLINSGVSEQSIYHLKGLDTPDSQKLFCFHAFHKPLPPPEFADLVDRFVKACEGLPFSLKVFGAQVCGVNERYLWEETLDELDKILPTEIYNKLKISYDSLGLKVKEIFLDIACFFVGEDGDTALRIWGKLGFRILQDRFLVEVDGENKIQMHNHIRDMGRMIAEEESTPLRLWHCTTDNIQDLLEQRTTLTNEVRGIKIVSKCDDFFQRTRFWDQRLNTQMEYRSFSKGLEMRLRYLRLVAAEEGYLEDILKRVQSPHLIWLRWYGCNCSSLPDWIPMENLRVLEVAGSILNILWPYQSQAVPLQLRELNIYAPLSEIPMSIGQLKYLERIVICCPPSAASTLERLPGEFCNMLSLKYLVFNGFSRMVSLPDRFGELTNLQHIELGGAASLQMLPNSFGNLNQLEHLSLEGASSLQMLPNSFGNLTRLSHLSLSHCKNLTVSNRALGNITKLIELDIGGCPKIRKLRGVEHLISLEKLYVKECKKLHSIPALGQLTKLTKLVIHGCRQIRELPGVEHLTSSENFSVMGCEKLQSIQGLGQLTKLTKLQVRECHEILELPGVEHLTSLESLSVGGCKKLQSIPGLRLLTKLTKLSIDRNRKIQELPGLEHLASLEKLYVVKYEKLQSIPGLGQLTELTFLEIRGCPEIQELPGVEHLTSLKNLNVGGCKKLQSIPGLGQLTKLTMLDVQGCSEIQELPGLEHLTYLEKLDAGKCPKLHWSGGVLEQLRQQLNDGFIYEKRQKMLKFPCLC